ncbi:CIA30 family protein [Gelidibacter sp.]|uniref:CIA30 family protein n=1 Tax=Gelidibacter sp. TaxID=2018083 RepID=UPI0032636E33
MNPQADSVIYDFSQHLNSEAWHIVNDGVMGGFSKGKMAINAAGNALFEGFITTENSGGFSSVKHAFPEKLVSNYKSVLLRIKGDGKMYQFRIKERLEQPFSYIHEFQTSGEWETIRIPLAAFYPSFRGHTLNMPNYNGESMQEVTFLIGNKKKEYFALEIERIWLE